jgi:hypothetical protein
VLVIYARVVRLDAENLAVVGALVDRCPSLLPVLDAHLDDYEHLLAHLFFGDVVRWAVRRHLDDSEDAELATGLALLEQHFAKNQADELIAVSFLENLPAKADPGAGIRQRLGPTMTKHLNEFLDR